MSVDKFQRIRDRYQRMKTWKRIGMIIIGCVLAGWFYLSRPLDRALFSAQSGVSLKITDRHGIVLREILSAEGGRSTWLAYNDIPETMIRAVVSAEDKRFFTHSGVDLLALSRALLQNLRGQRIISGASTITQQLVKIKFGYPRTIRGKLREMITAVRLEHTLSKQEILTQYLNRVEFCNLAFGIEAAAQLYFRKPARHLSLAESVFLAGIIQAPSRLNPYRHVDRAVQRQKLLLDRMAHNKTVDDASYQIARREAIRLTPKDVNFKAPHFCEFILATNRGQTSAPASVIQTTLDYYLQQRIEAIVRSRLAELANYNVTNAAVLVLDNRTGEVLAYLGSQDFFDDQVDGQVDGVRALRQPGSALKPFTYQLALERSYTPATLIPDIQDYPAAPRSFLPENYDRQFHGPVRLRQALACSYNIPAVRVMESIGVETLYDRLHALGFDSLTESPAFYGPGLTLGNGEVTLFELTSAYSILARRGSARQVHALADPVSAQTTSMGAERQLFAPQPIYLLTHILADRQAAIPVFGEDSPLKLPFPAAAKTGTSKDYRDNWTVGYTRDYTVGVWVGNFDGSPMRQVSGISGAAPIYRDVMLALYPYHDPANLLAHPPEGIRQASICPLSGQLAGDDCPHAIQEIFLQGTEPTEDCAMHRAYWVDNRDHLLTEPDAPYATRQVFIHFPPLYQVWAHEMGYPLPPTRYSPHAQRDESRAQGNSMSLQIVHPNQGDVYAIDPVLRREYQTVQFSAVVPPDISQVTWYVNDTAWSTVEQPFQAEWQITPGTHRIYAAGESYGQWLQSQEITVYVIE